MCLETIKILKGDKPDGCSKKTCLYIICLVMFTILEGLMLDAVCKPSVQVSVVNNVLNLHNLLLYMDVLPGVGLIYVA